MHWHLRWDLLREVHLLRVTGVLKDGQIAIKFESTYLAAVIKPFGALIAKYILKYMLA
jgi:hypothetical protein